MDAVQTRIFLSNKIEGLLPTQVRKHFLVIQGFVIRVQLQSTSRSSRSYKQVHKLLKTNAKNIVLKFTS